MRQLLARGEVVEAAVRDPERAPGLQALLPRWESHLRIHRVDVTNDATVAQLAETLGDTPVDLLINDAGVYGASHIRLRELDVADAARTYDVNVLGALRVTIALLPHLRRGTGRKLANISSGMGSIAGNTNGGHYGYRMSKAALNMMTKTLAVDLRSEKIVSIAVNPGWVRTAMGGPEAPTAVEDSARGILRVIDGATLETTGEFFDWNGGRSPW